MEGRGAEEGARAAWAKERRAATGELTVKDAAAGGKV
jgi:hypothetical protein